jgi:hypothetical protein
MKPDEIEEMYLQLEAEDEAPDILAIWVARTAERRQTPIIEANEDADPGTLAAFAELEPLEVRLLRHVERSRSVGIEDEVLGGFLASELSSLGYSDSEEVEKLIADAGVAWRFRTAEERLIAAAAELLAMAMEPTTLRTAFAGLGAE